MAEERIVFALDIGTRSIIGVVGTVRDKMLDILQVETLEHSERAMIDGQIEDIEQTARVAQTVKERLEARLGFPLREVHVAAAGRVLKTRRAICEMELDEKQPIGPRQQAALESKAVQAAYDELIADQQEGEEIAFCCVGHSVVHYELDGYSFSTLLGHRGRRAKAELIATFLPSEVVESLYTTMGRVGLSIASMTLEPIAAMNAVVPKELRLLNVALVDVGAGTSDIAVADGGSVCGYTMATIAGDEITEQLMREFLVDFEMAEKMKWLAGEGRDSVDYTDILGLEYTVSGTELLERMNPSVEELAKNISEKILQINGRPPMAVFLVGGGSSTAGLCGTVARELGIDAKKVAVGGNNYMKRTVHADEKYLCADYATPVGIAVTAMSAENQENASVVLNGDRVRLLRGGAMTVIEALLRGGYQYGQIMGRSGKSVPYELNGESRMARGEPPALAVIEVNGKPSGVTAPLQPGDEVRFEPAVCGADAVPRVRDVATRWHPFTVELLGVECAAGTQALVEGEPVDGDRLIERMERIEIRTVETLGDLLESEGYDPGERTMTVNGRVAGLDVRLSPGDVIEELAAPPPAPEPPPVRVREYRPEPQSVRERELPSGYGVSEKIAGRIITVTVNGRPERLPPKEDGTPYLFFDMFNYVDIDPAKPQGEIVLNRNGRPASYLDPVQDGDQIDIFWKRK